MHPNESPSVFVSRRGHAGLASDPLRTLVWLRGEHDIATRVHLSDTITQAARLDDADIVVDLSGVTFMDASTIGALVAARNGLRASSRSLSVRSPSPRAWRVLDLCGQIDDQSVSAQPPVAAALGSWVDVPARHRDPDFVRPPTAHEATSYEPAHVTARRSVGQAAVQPRRAAP